MKKRLISLALALVMVCTMIPAAAAEETFDNFQKTNTYAGQFSDVPTTEWYAEYVKTAYELALVKGVSDTSFNPNGKITLAESIALACRLHSIYMGDGAAFVQGNPWYQVYVDYATEQQIVEANEFANLDAVATRAQFAGIFANALPEEALKAINNLRNGDIPDVEKSSAYGEEIYRLYNAGILTGSDKYGTFNPKTGITRSEVSAIVTRMADESLRRSFYPVKDTTDHREPTAWEELTEDDDINFRTFLNVLEDTLGCVENAEDYLDRLYDEDASYAVYSKGYEYLADCYEYFRVLSRTCEDYDYMEDTRELAEMAMDVIDLFLELLLPESGANPDYFITEYADTVITVASLADYLEDEAQELQDTMFS